MKKQITLLLLLIIGLSSHGQKGKIIKTTIPCTDKIADTVTGKWINPKNKLSGLSLNKTEIQQVSNRLNAINKLLMQVFPNPTGVDVAWGGTIINTSFADEVRYVMNQNQMLNEEPVKTNPVSQLVYNLILYPYYCGKQDEIWNIFPEISGSTGVTIHANYLEIINESIAKDDLWTIDGRPIKYKMPAIGKWNGYDLFTPEGGVNAELYNTRSILITRKGMLPYIPVTRKQYLDRAIPYVTKFYDKMVADANQIQDKATRDEYKKGYIKDKNDALKKYQDELEKTAKNGLLDSPAIISKDPAITTMGPIFSTESEGGRMLVAENPNYFRKDLPKYVPQFFVLKWSWNKDPWSQRFKKAIEEYFPIETLQAMIDK